MIKTHKELSTAIKDKSILLLNSLGKDAILCLEWLNKFAKPRRIISLTYEFDARWPDDKKYISYLKKRYPDTTFVFEKAPMELTEKMSGMLQSPVFMNHIANHQEYSEFSTEKCRQEALVKYQADYLCSGMACYEGMIRAIMMKRKGLLHESSKTIYPIGLMKKNQVMDLIKKTGIKLNTSYKFAPESYDSASYFKMRSGLIARPEYREIIYKHYPLMALDEYRFEVLFK